MKRLFMLILLPLLLTVSACSESTQQADPDFKPSTTAPSYTAETSPVVLVDAAHHNFHTINGRYKPFAQVLTSDGFTVRSNAESFTLELLQRADIVVIANALDRNRSDWQPPFGRALNDDEVESVKQWVMSGGSLLLIADHTPFPKFIQHLAQTFGFEFSNGHVRSFIFRSADATLSEHAITQHITQVKTFGGSAFKAPDAAVSLLTLGAGAVSSEPETPFQITSSTPRIPVDGWSQGAVVEFGKGRVAVFAEGMMFSSQLDTTTGKTHGLRSAGAEQNEQFLLNVMHWLAGVE